MELFSLDLRSALAYRAAELDAALAPGAAPERLLVYPETALADGPDGPRLAPGARPARAGFLAPPGAAGPSLPAGEYAFAQDDEPLAADVAGAAARALEWFARECWWTGEGGSGDYYVRLVPEDGKTAVQVLRRK